MAFFLPSFRASLLGIGRHHCHRVVSHCPTKKYKYSNDARGGSPLFLWLPEDKDKPAPPLILIHPTEASITVSSPQDVTEAVENHYHLSHDSQQFVGGMGESDPGVWFACSTTDPLHHWRLIQESIRTVKEFRHGIPFGIHTSGVHLPKDLPPLAELGLDRVQVALLAANPKDYASATGLSDAEAQKCFGQVCGFCVTVAETGFPFEVGVLQSYASPARDLAVSLGAVDVHVWKN
jgi:hypothetical protein